MAPIGWPREIPLPFGLVVRVQAQLAGDGDGLGGEGLVDLDQVDVVELHVGPVEHLAHRRDRAHAHDPRVHAGVAYATSRPSGSSPWR